VRGLSVHQEVHGHDIVFSTSIDGVDWSDVTRIPIDDVASGVDHFIPGLDYISTSFPGGSAATVFAVGKSPTTAPFDEAMYSPGRLSIATPAHATRLATSSGVASGPGTGDTIQALKRD
jgi:hypothetical protein